MYSLIKYTWNIYKIDLTLRQQASLRMKTTWVICSDQKQIKLENNSHRVTRKISHVWKVGNILLNNPWVIHLFT